MAKVNLTTSTTNFLRAAQNKYKKDFVGFYQSLAGHYIGERQAIKDITVARNSVELLITNIDRLISPTTSITQTEINNIYSSLDKVEKDFKFWVTQAEADTILNERLQKVAGSKGLEIQKLSQSQNIIRGRLSKLLSNQPGLIQKWKEASPESFGTVSGVGHTLLGAFGPIGNLASSAIGMGQGVIQRRQERKRLEEQATLASHLLTSSERTPEAHLAMSRFLNASSSFKTTGAVPTGELGVRGIFGGHKEVLGDMTASLFGFFNTLAYRARWTKELLEVVKERNFVKSTIGSEKSGIPGVAVAIPIPPWVGPLVGTLGIISAALIGAVVAYNKIKNWGKGVLDKIKAHGGNINYGSTRVLSTAAGIASGMINPIMGIPSLTKQEGQLDPISYLAKGLENEADKGIPLVQTGVNNVSSGFKGLSKIAVEGSQNFGKLTNEGFLELKKAFDNLAEKISPQKTQIKLQSGRNTTDTDDPWISSLGAGLLDIS